MAEQRDWAGLAKSPKLRRVALWIAFLALLLGLGLSLRSQPIDPAQLDWVAAALVLLLPIPLVLLCSALEYRLMGRLLGQRVGFGESAEITVIGAAANMLPLPGSTLVRMAGLAQAGARLRDGALISLLVFLAWLAAAAAYAGGWLISLDAFRLGFGFCAGGLALTVGLLFAVQRYPQGGRTMIGILALRLAVVVLEAVRLHFCFQALGLEVAFAQSSALTVTTVLGSTVSLVPAGLGLREAVAAAFAPLLGLTMGAAFLAALLNRLLAMLMVVPLAGVLLLRAHDRLGGLLPGTGEQRAENSLGG